MMIDDSNALNSAKAVDTTVASPCFSHPLWRIAVISSLLMPATVFAQSDISPPTSYDPLPVESPAPAPTPAQETPAYSYDDALSSTTVNGAVTGEAILTTCTTLRNESGSARNQRFQNDCNDLVGGASTDPAGASDALGQLAADQVNAQNSAAVRAAGAGVAVVQNRVQRIRLADRAGRSMDTRIASIALSPFASGGGASADLTAGPFGGFLNYDWDWGDENQTSFQPGYDYSRWSLTGGMDYRINDAFVAGLAVRYTDDNVDFDHSRGDLNGETWGVTAYASYFLPNGLFFDGSVGYANTSYEMKRRINYTVAGTAVRQIARSDPDADIWSLSLGAGYDLFVNSFSITPSLRFNYVENRVDGYRERMSNPSANGGGMALSVGSQTYTSFTSNLGVQLSRTISTNSGVFVPQLHVGWIHEYQNGQEQVGATFVDDINNTPLYVSTNKPDHNYFEAGIGLSAQFPKGRSAFIAYNTLLGYEDVTYNAITAGVRLEF